ncbi:hypothetical protein F5B20DRAFT_590040 [Whalleya microplaca]|nr:hypothetical protein F5B20DRAFT_590040 [Whalleya microplaca]
MFLRQFPMLTDDLVLNEDAQHANSALLPPKAKESPDILTRNFEVSVYETAFDTTSFERLCSRGVLGASLEESGGQRNKPRRDGDWIPTYAPRVTFVRNGGLFLEFKFPDVRVDDTPIFLLLRPFAAATRGEIDRGDIAPDPTIRLQLDSVDQKARYAECDPFTRIPPPVNSDQIPNRVFTVPTKRRPGRCSRSCRGTSGLDSIQSKSPPLTVCTITKFAMTVDTRSELEHTFSESPVGNLSVLAVVRSTVGELLGISPVVSSMISGNATMPGLYTGSLAKAALAIHRAANAVHATYARQGPSTLALPENPQEAREVISRELNLPTTGVRASFQAMFGADLKFGIPGIGEDGTPRWVRKPWISSEGEVVILPRKGGIEGDANWEFAVALGKEDMRRLESILERTTLVEQLGSPELQAQQG